MRLKFAFIAALAATSLLSSCVKVDDSLGENYLATNMKYDVYTAEFEISDIEMQVPDSLSCFSTRRFSIGAIRDDEFGLTTRSAAFTLVPVAKTLDFGKPGTRIFRNMHLSAVNDSVSCNDRRFASILQNVNVYELEKPLDKKNPRQEIKYIDKIISKGIPVLNGADSLSIDFTEEFGKKFFEMTEEDLEDINVYEKHFPGIYLTCDEPVGNGGRINMFKLPINVTSGTMNGSYATLTFSAEYEGRGQVDTTFLFYLGPVEKYDLQNASSTSITENPQVAYNQTTHSTQSFEGSAAEKIYFEGGCGLKPVIKAEALRTKINEIISAHGDPSKAIINKASIILPFDFPENYLDMDKFPSYLSPTCRITNKDNTVTFAGITDASVSTENHGDVNRSLCVYQPDVTHHIQQLVRLENSDNIANYDVWFLALADEITTTTTSTNNDMSEYYQQMAYANYYNSMYGGYGGYGYSGYGGYGGYGNSYSNYYNYLMLAQMMSTPTTQQNKEQIMDIQRYYRCALHGPEASENRPKIKITFSIEKSE